jgi:translation initiation factor 2 beta subunit (eIF-2beta)/eIF-5
MIKEQNLENGTEQELTIPVVVCSACGAKNSIRWDKHCIGIDDKQGSDKDLIFQFCEECGDVTNVDFS